MKRGKIKGPLVVGPGTTLMNCSIQNIHQVPPITENVTDAVKAIAEASKAHAGALERLADRLMGPANNSIAVKMGGTNE